MLFGDRSPIHGFRDFFRSTWIVPDKTALSETWWIALLITLHGAGIGTGNKSGIIGNNRIRSCLGAVWTLLHNLLEPIDPGSLLGPLPGSSPVQSEQHIVVLSEHWTPNTGTTQWYLRQIYACSVTSGDSTWTCAVSRVVTLETWRNPASPR